MVRFGMSSVPTSWMSMSKLVEVPTVTVLMKVLSTEIFMLVVSIGDGVTAAGDGVPTAGVTLLAVPPVPPVLPQAAMRRSAAAAPRVVLVELKVCLLARVAQTAQAAL